MKILARSLLFGLFCLVLQSPKAFADERTHPQLIIQSYEVDREAIIAGTDCNIKITIKNTSAATDVNNILLYFESSSNILYPSSGLSNQKYIKSIEADGVYSETLNLTSNPLLGTSGAFNLNIHMEYQNATGAALSSTGVITLFINADKTISMINQVIPDDCVKGVSSFLNIQYENANGEDIRNVRLWLEGDIGESEKEIFIGSMKANSSSFLDAYVTFQTTGEQKLTTYFTFEDIEGNEYTSKSYTITTNALDKKSGGDTLPSDDVGGHTIENDSIPEEPSFFSSRWGLVQVAVGAVSVLAIIVIIFFIRKKR